MVIILFFARYAPLPFSVLRLMVSYKAALVSIKIRVKLRGCIFSAESNYWISLIARLNPQKSCKFSGIPKYRYNALGNKISIC